MNQSTHTIETPPLGALVRRAAADDQRAARELFDRYAPRVMGYCVLQTDGDRDVARDITQESFIRVFKNLHGLENPGAFEGWMWTIVRREVFRRGTKKSRYAEILGGFELDHDVLYAEDDKVGREQRIAVVRAVLEEIEDDTMREIAMLKYTEPEHTTREIAEKLSIPHGTVTVKLMRFRDQIANRLARALRDLDLEPSV